ncbi:MAG: class I SAM-dependent methyltransferase [Deltaproteobacteria bacterium]|nr:class I SAM-dependent methyltransferase [Deltaproteobacteria bacterium]
MAVRPYQFKKFKYNSHYRILKILSQTDRRLRILDVGTADGYLGAVLKARGHWLAGVEREGDSAERAKSHYDAFHYADIEKFDFPYSAEFDYILFADVLEHLRDPEAVLRRSLPCLKKDGEVIVSVPNIANLVVRLSLLFGRFDYRDRGILDRTHLRFFTLSSLNRMLKNCGCDLLDVAATPIPVQLAVAATDHKLFAPLHEFHYLLVRMWRTLLAYQFVVRAAPRPRG